MSRKKSQPVWSKDRPQKPNRDPMLDDIVELMAADKRSAFAKANVSGLSPATLRNWEKGKVSRPQGVSMQMAYKMLGYELKRVPIEENKVVDLDRRRRRYSWR